MSKYIELIKHFEGLHDGNLHQVGLQPKMCPAGVWTEGWGRAMIDPATRGHLRGAHNRQRALQLSTIRTIEEADAALMQDVLRLGEIPARRQLGQQVWDRLNDDQRGAIISFTYNCGTGRPPYRLYANVTRWLDKAMSNNQLADYWANSVITANGRVLPGLVRRRTSEAILFLTGELILNPPKDWMNKYNK
jgi:lysozyme